MRPEPRILVGVDGSADAEQALHAAVGLARALGAEVLVVHAVMLLTRLGPGPAVPSEQHLDEIRRQFEEQWCGPLLDAGVAFRRILVPGEPVATLLRLAEQRDVDMIVLGRRGDGGAGGAGGAGDAGGTPQLLLGSTCHQLTQHAPCPVLVVPFR